MFIKNTSIRPSVEVESDEGAVGWKYDDYDDDDDNDDDDSDDDVDIAFIGKSKWLGPISRNGPFNVAQWAATWIENKLSYAFDDDDE